MTQTHFIDLLWRRDRPVSETVGNFSKVRNACCMLEDILVLYKLAELRLCQSLPHVLSV